MRIDSEIKEVPQVTGPPPGRQIEQKMAASIDGVAPVAGVRWLGR